MRSYSLLTAHISVKIKLRHTKTKQIVRFYKESAITSTDNSLKLTSALETLLHDSNLNNIELEPIAVGVNFGQLSNAYQYVDDLFSEKPSIIEKKLNNALDVLNSKYGKNTIYLGGAHNALYASQIKIAFNYVPDV